MVFPDFLDSINKPLGKDARLFNFEDSSWGVLDNCYKKYINNYTNKDSFIPKNIHQIWLGSDLPQESKELQKKIIDFHPDWNYKLWTDKDLCYFGSDFENKMNKIDNFGLKSDIFRYKILEAIGGIYLDCDFYCIKPFESLIKNVNFFAGVCDPGDNNLPLINNGFFGCSINHPILKNISIDLKDTIDKATQYHNQVEVFNSTGPSFFTRQIFTYLTNNSTDKIVIFPSTFFYPINNRKRNFITKKMLKKCTYDETIAIHLWNASWVTTKQRSIDKVKDRLPLRYIKFMQNIKNIHYRSLIITFILSKFSFKNLFRYIREYYLVRALILKSNPEITVKKYPILTDYHEFHEIDFHYTYHPAWALRKVVEISPKLHIDLASKLDFSLAVSAFVPVEYHDFREVNLQISNFKSVSTDLQNLPFKNNSIESLSCMHVIEHIGLGRYGDPINLHGDIIAMNELIRVLAIDGHLLFVTPISDVNRIEFNAHRVYSYKYIMEIFKTLTLLEFSLITDNGDFIENCEPFKADAQNYGCGCFLFKKEK